MKNIYACIKITNTLTFKEMKIRKFLALVCAAVAIGFAATSCTDEPIIPNYSVITFENATLNSAGILLEQTLIGEDDFAMGNFWKAYTEQGITFRSFVGDGSPFWWCGLAISSNHNMIENSYTNEWSVYNTKGHSGSKFVVCYYSEWLCQGMSNDYVGQFYVDDGSDKIFDHVYITNSTYAALSIMNGENGCKKFTYADHDWFKVTITGFDHTGAEKGSIDFYLADFRASSSVGVVRDWTKVDLSSLGAVQRIEFTMSSTDNGGYGMNNPSYFCLDDLAVRN